MYRAAYAAACKQRWVGRVDDGVNALPRNVAFQNINGHVRSFAARFRSQSSHGGEELIRLG
jgi:hypothetical protein